MQQRNAQYIESKGARPAQPTVGARRMRDASVETVVDITPRVRRITLCGEDLRDFHTDLPGQWVKLFVPVDGQGDSKGRAYTIRRFDPGAGRMEIDFVRHGDGPLSTWAEQAEPGMHLQLAGPASTFCVQDDAQWLFLAGDDTALPAILAILESRPATPSIRVYLEVENPAEEQPVPTLDGLHVEWLHRDSAPRGQRPGALLEERLRLLDWSLPGGQIWIAAESATIRSLRLFLTGEVGLSRSSMHLSGYWKLGAAAVEREEGSDY